MRVYNDAHCEAIFICQQAQLVQSHLYCDSCFLNILYFLYIILYIPPLKVMVTIY